jgi:hypothetical protein
MGALAPGQKWWWIILEIEISCSQWEGSAYTQSALILFFFKFWVGAKEGFFHFSFLPNMFLSSFQWVPIMFSICFQCVPQGCSQ